MRNTAVLSSLLVAALALTGCSDNHTTRAADSISVSGTGKVSAQPDIFSVVATARQQGDDIDAMKERVDSQVDRMLELADDLDIEEKQVTASTLRISPQWQYQPERKLIGHEVSRDVTFRVKGLETYARLLDGLAKQHVKDIRPAGSEVSNEHALSQRALKKAVQDARQQAEVAADAADRSVGKAIRIDVQGTSAPHPVMMMARAKDAATESYRAGETDITAQVQVTFELE
ncbi:enolase [Alcanivorax hongdengensis A-11-3]|uniref:Enolase n=1 Tax=Alcanivorax hongdengensis A-11-3 TaxID=1177179 RepID=L0WDB3_9GAMM|nr:SIMPL domain-containing protein [Alcanivorax hongdengensis]EKF74971.1 enolase [Alcanivorax hongdengensis A-11-3]